MTDISFQPLMKTNETMFLLPGSILLFNYHKESFYGTMAETCQNRWHTRSDLKRLAARNPFRSRSI